MNVDNRLPRIEYRHILETYSNGAIEEAAFMFIGVILPVLLYCGPIPWALGAYLMVRWFDGRGSFQKTFIGMTIVHCAAFLPLVIGLILGASDILHALVFPAITGVVTAPVGLILFVLVVLDVTGCLSWLDEKPAAASEHGDVERRPTP